MGFCRGQDQEKRQRKAKGVWEGRGRARVRGRSPSHLDTIEAGLARFIRDASVSTVVRLPQRRSEQLAFRGNGGGVAVTSAATQ